MMKRVLLAVVAVGTLGAVGCNREEEPSTGALDVMSTEVVGSTLSYLDDHRAELKMRAPKSELVAMRAFKDDLAMTHVRFRQVERGVRVIGGSSVVHYDAAGGIQSLQQSYVPDLDALDVNPKIDATRARTLVGEGESVLGEPELVIFAFERPVPRLAWEMTVRKDRHTQAWLLTIDANTGEVLSRISRQHSAQGTGVGVFGKKRNIEFTSSNGQFALVDTSRAFKLTTFDSKSSPDTSNATVLLGANANTWDTTARLGKGSGVDAHANIGLVVDYYAKKFGRKSWDDKNGDVQIIVHVGDDTDGAPGFDNAYYDEVMNAMSFGDGRELLKPTAGFLDVTAHELTHAVTHYSSNLRYENQSGALNESMSDVFAAMIEHSIAPDDKNNWLVGEDSLLDESVPAMRDMTVPSRGFQPQPSHMNEFERTLADAGGVHINSGIPNKAAQLMTVGGNHGVSGVTIPHGIGWENTEKVWYRANTTYLTETSTFADAADATMKAAQDLKLSQDDQNVIDCAWKAVGVVNGQCAKINPATTPPKTTPGGSTDTTSEDSSSRGNDSSEDDDDDSPSPKKKSKRRSASSAGTEGQACSTIAPGTGGAGWAWLLAAGAVVMGLRRRRAG